MTEPSRHSSTASPAAATPSGSGPAPAPGGGTLAPLRVAILDRIGKWGGGQKWAVQTAVGLRAAGHEAWIACERGKPLHRMAEKARVPVWTASFRGGWNLLASIRLGLHLRREGVRVIVGNVTRDLLIGALAARLCGARLLQRRGLLRPVRGGILSRWLYTREVARIIVNASAIRDRMMGSVDFLPAARFVLIPNGIDTRVPPASWAGATRESLGLGDAGLVVGIVGRLAAMKGHRDLIHAWKKVAAAQPGVVLAIVGEGEEEEPLRALVASLGLERSVRFLGFCSIVQRFLGVLDVFVLPSVRDEGCSNTLLEAMWQGVPAVVTDCGGLPEVIEDGADGLVVPVGDTSALAAALTRLIGDPELRRRLGGAAQAKIAERYSQERILERTIELFREVEGAP